MKVSLDLNLNLVQRKEHLYCCDETKVLSSKLKRSNGKQYFFDRSLLRNGEAVAQIFFSNNEGKRNKI
jgi:hypothetical protein